MYSACSALPGSAQVKVPAPVADEIERGKQITTGVRMGPRSTLRNRTTLGAMLGWIAVAAALALSAPGIRVARAVDDGTSEFDRFQEFTLQSTLNSFQAEPSTSCRARDGESDKLLVSDQLAQVQRQLVARIRRDIERKRGTDQPLALNGRGYNYANPPRGLGPPRLEVEAPSR